MKAIIIYYSRSGNTEKIAKRLLIDIVKEKLYCTFVTIGLFHRQFMDITFKATE